MNKTVTAAPKLIENRPSERDRELLHTDDLFIAKLRKRNYPILSELLI